jgi:TonB family protein
MAKPKIDKDKRRGIIITVIVHTLVFVSLFLIALRTPLPLPGEEGVEVNLGFTATGQGNIQSDAPPPQALPTPPPVKQQSQPEPEPVVEEEEIIEQNIEEAPVLEEVTEEKPEEPKEKEKVPEKEKEKTTEPIDKIKETTEEQPVDTTFVTEEIPEEVPVSEPEPVVNQRALFKGTTTSDTQGTNQGITGGIGDQGKAEGDKDSNKYDGRGGKGNGPSAYLGGRGSLYLEEPGTDFKEQGDVVIEIWVNRDGIVKNAQVKRKGTNILDDHLKQIAINAAMNSKFERDPQADELQRGTITYKFVLLK